MAEHMTEEQVYGLAYATIVSLQNEVAQLKAQLAKLQPPPEPECPPEPDTPPPESITIQNVHNYMDCIIDTNFETDDIGTKVMCVMWDENNEELCNIADNEFRYNLDNNEQKNLMWVEKLKKYADWKEGEYIYAFTKTNVDGAYWIHYKKDKTGFDWYNTIVDKKGFVAMEIINNYGYGDDDDIKFSNFYRPWSVYNGIVCDKQKQ